MTLRLLSLIIAAAISAATANFAQAEPTALTVRVLSKDAKWIGSSMGGAQIIVRDAHSGAILAQGLTKGDTGNTKRMMQEPQDRRVPMSDDKSAKFETTLDLDTPRLIEVEAFGPMGQMQAAHKVTSTQWVVPGRGITGGDGWVLELPGFVVDVLDPPAHVKLTGVKSVGITANVTMMCGCPIEPKGLWDADKYEVKAIVTHDGKVTGEVDLKYAGKTSQFAGVIPVDGAGVYDVTVYAYDYANGNTGVDRTTFMAAN